MALIGTTHQLPFPMYHLYRRTHRLWILLLASSKGCYKLFMAQRENKFSVCITHLLSYCSDFLRNRRNVLHARLTYFMWESTRSLDDPINVLFTMARDGICRIWSPLILLQPESMSICAIIDPNQWLVSQQQSITQYPIHALDGMEFAMAVEYAASKTVDKNNDANSIRLRKLKEIVRDTSDLFFQIQGDGSMVIWGVQVCSVKENACALGLHSFISFSPLPFVFYGNRISAKYLSGCQKFSLCCAFLRLSLPWKRLSSCETSLLITTLPWREQEVRAQESFLRGWYLLRPFSVAPLYLLPLLSNVGIPADVVIVGQSHEGRVSCFSVNMMELFDSANTLAGLSLRQSWTGQQSRIKAIVKDHRQLCFTSVGDLGDISLWKLKTPRVSNIS